MLWCYPPLSWELTSSSVGSPFAANTCNCPALYAMQVLRFFCIWDDRQVRAVSKCSPFVDHPSWLFRTGHQLSCMRTRLGVLSSVLVTCCGKQMGPFEYGKHVLWLGQFR